MKWLKCEDIIDVRDGTHDSPQYVTNGYPLVTSKNIQDNKIDFENINKRSKVSKGDIIMPMIGTVGNPVIVQTEKEFAIKNVALFKKSESILTEFLYYVLISNIVEKQFSNTKRGGTQKFVSLKNIRNLEIPLPPLQTQKKTVSLLDGAQSLIDKRKEQIALLDELIKSTFYDMFGDPVTNPMGWEEICLSNIFTSDVDYRGQTPPKSETGIPLISSANVQMGYLSFSKASFISDVDYGNWLKRGVPDEKDVIITTEAPMGRVALYPKGVYQLSRRVIAFKPNSDISNSQYLLQALISTNWQLRLYKKVRGTTVPRILKPDLLNQVVPCPPLPLQNKFAKKVKKIEKQKAKMEKGLKEMEDLFGSLMQRAFRGEIE